VLGGYLLILLGGLVAIPALALLVGVPWVALSGDDVQPSAWITLAACVLGATALLWAGLRLARGRRHLVLFLRRFGFDDASETLTIAVSGAMGRRWRLVTLDDSEIRPVGVRRSSRIAWSAGRWIALLLLVLAIAFAANWWFGGGADRLIGEVFDSSIASSEESGQNPFEAIVVAVVVSIAIGAALLGILLLLAAAGISALGIASLGLWSGNRAVRQAEGSKALVINEASSVEPVVDRIRGHAGRIQAPRLVVVKVHDSIWREVVHELANDASVALIDISDPTEHLLWEVALLQGDIKARMMPVGRRDRVEALAVAQGDDPAGRLRMMLAEESVLVYDTGQDRRAARRFARNLSAALDRMEV